jgi:PKD repeat protein
MIRKFILPLTVLSAVFFFSSCDDDDDSPTLNPDFSLSVSGEAPDAEVTIINTSTGATDYAWTFSEGAEIEETDDDNPGAITVDKAGTFEVTLTASNGSATESVTKTIEIEGENAIVVYQNVEFARDFQSATYGPYFSVADGKIYKHSELNATTGPKIDLVYDHIGDPVNYFATPDDADEAYGIPGANTTRIINYPADLLSVATFDAATNASFIENITIGAADEESFGTTHPYIVLFETESGRKGAIKTKAMNADRLVVDIKVEKY